MSTVKNLCACRCGKEINPWAKYSRGHWPRTAETRAVTSAANLGNPNVGQYERTEEHRAKMSEVQQEVNSASALVGRPRPQEVRDKISRGLTGKHLSQETKELLTSSTSRGSAQSKCLV